MSAILDRQYVHDIAFRLDKFKRKSNCLYNFRCPICGDSKKHKNKARGYLFERKNAFFYKCHNCQASMSFGNLIKFLDPILYKKYCVDRYKSGEIGVKPHKKYNYTFKPVRFDSKDTYNKVLFPMSKLPEDHEAIVYLKLRKIPQDKIDSLFFVDDASKLSQLSDDYKGKIHTNEPRIVFPFYDENENLVGVTARAIRGEKFLLRYIVVRIKDNSPMLFNLNKINKDETIYVTEGCFDSMFLDNSIAVGNANLKSTINHLPKEKLVLIYDNERRNANIRGQMRWSLLGNIKICIWPKSIVEKDINEMIMKNRTKEEIIDIINKNTFSSPRGLLEFQRWESNC